MKKKFLMTALALISMISFMGCSREKVLKADTPVNVGILAKNFISSNNYENLNNLFSEDMKNKLSEEEFRNLNNITTSAAGFKNYELITFENGKMILIQISSEKVDGEYKIEDIINVPEEMKDLFKD